MRKQPRRVLHATKRAKRASKLEQATRRACSASEQLAEGGPAQGIKGLHPKSLVDRLEPVQA